MKKRTKLKKSMIAMAVAAVAFITTLTAKTNVILINAADADVEVKLTTDKTEVKAGDTLTVTLAVEKNAGLAALTVQFNFDNTVLSLESVPVVSSAVRSATRAYPDASHLEESNERGFIGFAYADADNTDFVGDILTAEFKVKTDAKVGDSTLTYVKVDASDSDAKAVSGEGVEGKFKVVCSHAKTTEKTTKEPTCTEQGEKITVCDICGETVKTEKIAALGHDYGEFEVVKEPTCTEEGEQSAKCKRCDEIKTEKIAVLGHDYGEFEVIKEPTCTEEGEQSAKCKRCDDVKTEKIPALGHTFDQYEIIKVETEEEEGEIKRICSRCGEEVINTIPKIDAANFTLDDPYGSEIKKEYYVGDTIELIASIYGTDNDEAQIGDIRYVPVAYQINEETGKWESTPYSVKLSPDSEGEYKIIVEYVREIKEAEGWTAGEKTYAFETIINAIEKEEPNKDSDNNGEEAKNNNGTGNTGANEDNNQSDGANNASINKTPAETVITDNKPSENSTDNHQTGNALADNSNKSSAPKTGDDAELIVMLITLMMVSGAVVMFEKNRMKEM